MEECQLFEYQDLDQKEQDKAEKLPYKEIIHFPLAVEALLIPLERGF